MGSKKSRKSKTSKESSENSSDTSTELPIRPILLHPGSSSSIQTISKIYDQKAEKLSPVPSRPIKISASAKLLPDKITGKNKSLQKSVLGTSSFTNDFIGNPSRPDFNKRSASADSVPTKSQSSILLPNFKTMDSIERSGSQTLKLPENLTSSKIYERRKNREKEEKQEENEIIEPDITDDILLDEHQNVDDVIKQKYNEKLNLMKKPKPAGFYSPDDEIDEGIDESDLDINSDLEHDSPRKQSPVSSPKQLPATVPQTHHIPVSRHKSHESKLSSSSTVSNEKKSIDGDSESKTKGFKGFLRRVTMVDELDDIPESLKRKNTVDNQDNEGFFSRLKMLGGSGLAPGATTSDNREKLDDEENQRIIADDGVEMQTLDPESFRDEAKKILQAHLKSKSNSNNTSTSSLDEHSDQTTLQDYVKSNDGFLAPNPDVYLRDDTERYDLRLDDGDSSFIPPPDKVRGGVLSSLLRLYQNPEESSRSRLTLVSTDTSPVGTPTHEKESFISSDHHISLANKLKKLGKKVKIDDSNLEEQQETIKKHRKNASFGDIGELLGHSRPDKFTNFSTTNLPSFEKNRPKTKKKVSGLKSKREHTRAKITVHIAETLQRQRFLFRLCKCLMLYGAPTHRLEEYLTMTARVLEIDAQFIYLPGCMIMAFGDATTRTSEVQLVRCVQGLDLYKLHRAHRIYKRVIHDLIGVEEACIAIDDLLSSKPLYSRWICVFLFAFSSAMITPLAFGGGWIDIPIAFGISGCIGTMQYYITPKSNLYSNVFEVTSSIVVAFIGRAIGSINGTTICFSAIVQGSLSMILPGYIILCGALELQSRNLVSGAVRMFYAIIYSLFLGFGLTLGAALYGWIDSNATSETTCSNTVNSWYRFIFVPAFTLGLALINQAKWFQLPIMLIISGAGYVVSYFSSKYFADSTEFTASLASFVIGVMGNLYSRIWKGIAVSAMLPGIFLQVPGGVGAKSTLLSGIQTADLLTGNTTSTDSSSSDGTTSVSFGITMVQIVIGISVGLFASTIFVYPFGKKSTAVFTL